MNNINFIFVGAEMIGVFLTSRVILYISLLWRQVRSWEKR